MSPTKLAAPVRVTEFGKARHETPLSGKDVNVHRFLAGLGIETERRRVAVNGFPVDSTTTVVEGDEVTVHPFVTGG
jgi:sulfur carrier protein ThiS